MLIEDVSEDAAVEGQNYFVWEDLVTLIWHQVDVMLLMAPICQRPPQEKFLFHSANLNFVRHVL